jgi:hypothetical protein
VFPMTFMSKYVPHYEAEKIIAERLGVEKDRLNPLGLALSESAILPEVHIDGEWKALSAGEWVTLKIFHPNSYVQSFPKDDEITLGAVRLLRADIDRLWPASQTAPSRHNSGGRPPEFDWEEILIEMARIVHHEGLPQKQADMVGRLQEWYAKRHAGKEPGLTEMKSRVSRLYKAIKSET